MTSYTLFSQAAPTGASPSGALNTLGLDISVSVACTCNGLWYYSPDASGLPGTIALWQVAGATLIDSQTPSWSGGAGSGWVFAPWNSPPVLSPSQTYRAAYLASGFDYDETSGYWTTGGAGAGGITNGPLTAPGMSNGQGWYNAGGTLTFPASQFNNTNWWLDVQVTPVPAAVTYPAAGEGSERRYSRLFAVSARKGGERWHGRS